MVTRGSSQAGQLEATFKGTLILPLLFQSQRYRLRVHHVHYIPQTGINIISRGWTVSILKARDSWMTNPLGYKVSHLKFKSSNLLELTGVNRQEIDRIFDVQVRDLALPITETSKLWHLRLGHLNQAYVKTMKDKSLCKGFTQDLVDLPTCQDYIQGKLQDTCQTMCLVIRGDD